MSNLNKTLLGIGGEEVNTTTKTNRIPSPTLATARSRSVSAAVEADPDVELLRTVGHMPGVSFKKFFRSHDMRLQRQASPARDAATTERLLALIERGEVAMAWVQGVPTLWSPDAAIKAKLAPAPRRDSAPPSVVTKPEVTSIYRRAGVRNTQMVMAVQGWYALTFAAGVLVAHFGPVVWNLLK